MRLQVFSLVQLRALVRYTWRCSCWPRSRALWPSISSYIQHALEAEQDIAADLGQKGSVHHHHAHHDGGPHEHGANDPNDPCCTLHHHLAGVIPIASLASRRDLRLSIIVAPRRLLAGIDPCTLERPPKLPLTF
jgi:ABC-type nickel/cobalt efflux system permease component RcnA